MTRETQTPLVFDDIAAKARRDAAMEQVARRKDWVVVARLAVLNAAHLFPAGFTTDDALRLDPILEKCPEKRVLGVAIRGLVGDGTIEPTGRYIDSSRVQSHARQKREWRLV